MKKLYIKLMLNRLHFFRNEKIKKIKRFSKKEKFYMEHYILVTDNKKYLVALGFSKLQKIKVDLMCRFAPVIKEAYPKYFKFNDPLCFGKMPGFNYAIYEYFENLKEADFNECLQIAQKVYNEGYEYNINEDNVDDFLLENIKIARAYQNIDNVINHPLYIQCRNILLKYRKIKANVQHCDYNLPNIKISSNGKSFLFDLERVSPRNIASYDWYHLLKCKNSWRNPEETDEMKKVPYSDFLSVYTKLI